MVITIADFQKVELKIGEILEAEKIEGSDKLLKLKVSFGEETRQILSGIARYYSPEELVNKQVTFVVNLEPRTMMGLESQGMILAADAGDGPVLLVPDRKVANGSGVK